MPSRLGRLQSPFQTLNAEQQVKVEDLPVFGPWGGLVQNVAPDQVDQRAFSRVVGLVPVGEQLVTDYGWVPLEDDGAGEMPLGGTGDAVPSLSGHPIVALMSGWQNAVQLAFTSAVAAGGNGALWGRLISGGPWTEINPVTAPGDEPTLTSAQPVTHTYYEGTRTNIWTTGVDATNSRIYYYPNAANYDVVVFPSGLTPVRCKSLTVAHERLFLWHTREAGTLHKLRVRWCIPGFSSLASPDTIWTDRGAGAIDLLELGTEGKQILKIGDSVACYADQGIAMLRSTGESRAPYRREILTNRRGLFGQNCAIEVERGVHFAVCTDGFFLLTEDGNMRELGTVDQSGVSISKWNQSFYASVNHQFADKVALGYDAIRKFVYIAWPDGTANANGDPNRVWIYDMRGDRVFEDTYVISGTNHSPVCFGRQKRVGGTFTGSGFWVTNSSPWTLITAPTEQLAMTHGTIAGQVYQHEPAAWRKVNPANDPGWSIAGYPFAYGDPTRYTTLLHKIVSYTGTGESTASISMALISHPGTATLFQNWTHSSVLPYLQTPAGIQKTFRFNPHFGGARIQAVLAGVQPMILQGWVDQYVTSMGEV